MRLFNRKKETNMSAEETYSKLELSKKKIAKAYFISELPASRLAAKLKSGEKSGEYRLTSAYEQKEEFILDLEVYIRKEDINESVVTSKEIENAIKEASENIIKNASHNAESLNNKLEKLNRWELNTVYVGVDNGKLGLFLNVMGRKSRKEITPKELENVVRELSEKLIKKSSDIAKTFNKALISKKSLGKITLKS